MGVDIIPFVEDSEFEGFIEELLFFVVILVPLSPFFDSFSLSDATSCSIMAGEV